MNADTTTTETPMDHDVQLATLLCFRAQFNEGYTGTSIAGNIVGKLPHSAERPMWENFKANLEQGTSFNNSLIGTGLFSTSVERIFAIVERPDKAIDVAIELLKAIRC